MKVGGFSSADFHQSGRTHPGPDSQLQELNAQTAPAPLVGAGATPSGETGDLAVAVDIHFFGGGVFRQARHGHDVAGNADQKPCPGGNTHFPYMDREAAGPAQLSSIVAQRIPGFGHADWCFVEPQCRQLLDCSGRRRAVAHTIGPVDFPGNEGNFLLDRLGFIVEKAEVASVRSPSRIRSASASPPSPPLAQTSETATEAPRVDSGVRPAPVLPPCRRGKH